MPRSDFRFHYTKRVRYAEIDGQMVVFNSRYLEYFDIGITEYWRATGFYAGPGLKDAPEFHVARALVNYRAPIHLDEEIDICVRADRIGSSSMTSLFEIHGAGREDLRANGELVNVHIGTLGGSPLPIPRHIIDLFERYEGRQLQAEGRS